MLPMHIRIMAIALKPTITLSEVMAVLFNRSNPAPVPFSIIAVSYDNRRGTGGEFLKLENCIVPPSKEKNSSEAAEQSAAGKVSRHRNNTVNLLNKMNDTYVKVHVDLIVEFNNQKVIW